VTVWGVYAIQGRTPDGRTVAEKDKAAARWFVRWRVDEVLKKRTFRTKGYARTFRDQLLRAKLMGWDADDRGWPVDPTLSSASRDHRASPEAAPATTSPSTRSFASYCDDVWWPIMGPTFGDKNMLGHRRNMRVAMDLLTYRPGDPRCTHPAAQPGESILLSDLTADDLRLALVARRSVNDRTRAANDRHLTAAIARGETDISLRPIHASAATVRAFFVTLSMIVKAAMQSGHTTGDPLTGVAKLAPAPKPTRVTTRLVPSIDEVFDLADAIASLGPVVDGHPAGERFRALVLAAGTLAARPGELVAHRPELIAFGTATEPTVVTFEETEAAVYDRETALRGRRTRNLKHREAGDTRQVPAIPETAEALRVHLDRGYDGHDRTFTSPSGRARLSWGNMTEPYWRPACERVFAGTSKSALAAMPPKTLRKAAITHWLDSGISIYLASDWAGHSTDVAELYYAGRSRTTYAKEVELLARRSGRTVIEQ
jgi:integrase